MSIVRKVVASAGAVALLVGSMVAVAPGAAQALDRTYGSLVLSPVGPYTTGQVVTMSWTDMNPANGISTGGTNVLPEGQPDTRGNSGGYYIGICVGGVRGDRLSGGPGDCVSGPSGVALATRLKTPQFVFAATLSSALANGSASMTIPARGAVAGFSTADVSGNRCDNTAGAECNLAVIDFRGDGPRIQIAYVEETAPPVAATAAVASGTARVGTLLTCVASFTGTVDSRTYAWYNNNVKITTATSNRLALAAGYRGRNVKCEITASNSAGPVTTASAERTIVAGTIAVRTKPYISGTVKVGKTIKTTKGAWSVAGLTYTYQWKRNGVSISGTAARKYFYKVVAKDKRKYLTCTVRVAKYGYTSTTSTTARKRAV
jgi:hypothetical protein